jgi:hypothetical protein
MNRQTFWPFTDVPSDSISIYDGSETFLQDFENEDPKSQVAFAAYWLQSEVLNGGLNQFFANDTGILAPEAATACRALGLPILASKIEEAMSWFGQTYPRKRERRQLLLEAFERVNEGQGPFDKLDDVVADLIYDEGGGLQKAAISYLRSNES